jgi:hypothetical protein
MKIDTALKSFTEKYDKKAIQSIDDISKEFGLVINRKKISGGFNLHESFKLFSQCLNSYLEYKLANPKEDEEHSNSEIIQDFKETGLKLFKDCDIKYSDFPILIKGYIEGVNTLKNTVDSIKGVLIENEIDQNSISVINELTDIFITEFHNRYDPLMERILKMSGYTYNKILSKKNEKKMKPVFL